jgi:hypothetical protein
LKKDDKELLVRLSQDDVLTTKSHPPPSKQYTRVIQEAVNLKGGDYKQGDLVLEWDTRKGQPDTHERSLRNFGWVPTRLKRSLSMIPTTYPHCRGGGIHY